MVRLGRRVAVIGCGRGAYAIALAIADPDGVVAGFDADPAAIAVARVAAARCGVADRVTFEVAAPGHVRGSGYDLVVLRPGPVGFLEQPTSLQDV